VAEDFRKCTGEKLLELWDRQFLYNLRVKEEQSRSSPEWMQTYLLGLISEVNEVLAEMNWKKHRLKSSREYGPNVGRELADLTKYVLCLWQEMGYSVQDMLDMTLEKSRVMELMMRQERGKLYKDQNIIVADMDGTLADFRKGFLDWIRQEKPWMKDRISEEVETLFMEVDNNWTSDEYRSLKEEFEEYGGYAVLPGIEWALEAVRTAVKDGDSKLIIWTARPQTKFKRVWYDTYRWLENHGVEFEELHIGAEDRVRFCENLQKYGNRVVLFDDAPENIIRASARGIPVVYPTLPYNRELKVQALPVSGKNGLFFNDMFKEMGNGQL